MTSEATTVVRPVLADLVPGERVRDALLVVGVALLTAAAAQFEVHLGFTPVPISGQTFAVLLGAAALGPVRGSLAQVLYNLLAIAGLPFYSGGASGWEYFAGATGGYLVGFVLAGAVVGALARRGLDRRPATTTVAFIVGSLIIYACGVPWLAAVTGMNAGAALANGALPFLLGDALKALLAAGLLPAAWRFVGR
ncbi:MAG: biotin transporter BioY [Egibacteraceae bacterium]